MSFELESHHYAVSNPVPHHSLPEGIIIFLRKIFPLLEKINTLRNIIIRMSISRTILIWCMFAALSTQLTWFCTPKLLMITWKTALTKQPWHLSNGEVCMYKLLECHNIKEWNVSCFQPTLAWMKEWPRLLTELWNAMKTGLIATSPRTTRRKTWGKTSACHRNYCSSKNNMNA